MMRVLLAGGGSGGHVFPAFSVASALEALAPEGVEFKFAGTADGLESELSAAQNMPFAAISARPLRGRNPLSQLVSLAHAVLGVLDALLLLLRFRPHVVFVTGGYVSAPVGVAAWIARRPIVLFQPDIEPGWTQRLLGPLASRVCMTHPDSADRYGGRAVVTGYPVRAIFKDLDQPLARARLQLNGGPAVLVTGAVRGARRINDCIAARLVEWLEAAQLVHVCGREDHPRLAAMRERLPPALQSRYRLYPFLGEEMPTAMAACDVAVSRAGASTLGELPAAALPAVLVPLPEAGGHQRVNARILADRGAAVIVENDDVEAELFDAVIGLLAERERLAEMRARCVELRDEDGASAIARQLLEARK